MGSPDKTVSLPGFDFLETCADLNNTIPLLLAQDDELCQQLQAFGSLCDCPVDDGDNDGVDRCRMCPDGQTIGAPNKEIPLFQDLFPTGILPTCELFGAYVSSLPNDDDMCFISQTFLGNYCDCQDKDNNSTNNNTTSTQAPSPSCSLCLDGSPIGNPNASTHLGFEGFDSCHDVDEAVSVLLTEDDPYCSYLHTLGPLCGCPSTFTATTPSCTMCTDGSDVPFPDKVIPFVNGSAFFGGFPINVTCALYESYVKTLSEDDEMCPLAQGISSYCGCPAVENHCDFCKNGQPVPESFKSKHLNFLTKSFEGDENADLILPTCEFAETITFQVPPTSDACLIQKRSWLCGCHNNGESDFAGAQTYTQKVLYLWAPRISAIISLVGSAAIAYDILTSKAKRSHTYCRLVLGVVFFDVVTSIGFSVSALPMPREVDGDLLGAMGAMGTMLTCKIQTFVLIFGYGTIMYNICLTLYYFLIIVHEWPEHRIKRVEPWFHIVSFVLATVVGAVSVPFAGPGGFSCSISLVPWSEQKWPFMLILVVPTYGGENEAIERTRYPSGTLMRQCFLPTVFGSTDSPTHVIIRIHRSYRSSSDRNCNHDILSLSDILEGTKGPATIAAVEIRPTSNGKFVMANTEGDEDQRPALSESPPGRQSPGSPETTISSSDTTTTFFDLSVTKGRVGKRSVFDISR